MVETVVSFVRSVVVQTGEGGNRCQNGNGW